MSTLDDAAQQVRRLKAEVNSAETAEKFHIDMAASARDELKVHRRNLEQAEKVLIKEAYKTPGAPVPGRNTLNNINTTSTKVGTSRA